MVDASRQPGTSEAIQHLVHFSTSDPGQVEPLSDRSHRATITTFDLVYVEMPVALFSVNQFNVLRDLIVPGTWIVFDELIGYRGWEHHEHKAFQEFLAATGHSVHYVAHGLTYTIARLG